MFPLSVARRWEFTDSNHSFLFNVNAPDDKLTTDKFLFGSGSKHLLKSSSGIEPCVA
jgi:hypothetical protein